MYTLIFCFVVFLLQKRLDALKQELHAVNKKLDTVVRRN
jgi:hypothetical protein